MHAPSDAMRLALTGQLPFILLMAAALAYPASRLLLWLYARAVLRSMLARQTPRDPGHAASHAVPAGADVEALAPDAALRIDVLTPSSPLAFAGGADALFRQTLIRPWRLAAVYVAAGAVYAAVMAYAFLLASGIPFRPVRFGIIAWTHMWPAVLATASIAATTRGSRLALLAAYAGVFAVMGSISLAASPDLTVGQLAGLWALNAVPTSVLLLAFLSRRVRGVGPLVLTFLVVAVLGSHVLIFAAGSTAPGMRAVVALGSAVGLDAVGIMAALVALGFLSFGVAGRLMLKVIGRWYQQRRISDQSLTFGTMWLLFAVTGSMDLVFEAPAWALTAVVAFGAYLVATRIGFRLLRRWESAVPAPQLLLLRVFALGRRSERLHDVLVSAWRHTGSVSLIAGPDLAATTIEPHEFLDFISGTLSRRFIDGPAALEQRLSEADCGRDPDGRFRVADFFCHDDTWQLVLRRLLTASDAVLMDLRGFTPERAGCIFEVHALVSAMHLDRVVFVVDRTTNRPLLERTVRDAWRTVVARGGLIVPGRLTLFELSHANGRGLRALLRVVCAAAREPGSAAS